MTKLPIDILEKLKKDNISTFSSNLATISSIALGFLLTGFAVMMSYSDKAFFKVWADNNGFAIWKTLYFSSLFCNILVLMSSFIILLYPNLLEIVIAVLSFSLTITAFVFIPVFNAATKPTIRIEDE